MIRPRALLATAVTAFAAGFAPLALLPHRAFSAGRFHPCNPSRPVPPAPPLPFFAFWFLDEEFLAPSALCAGLACLTKEHIGFTVAALGVWYALTHHRPREGLLIAAGGALVAVVAVGWLVPHFAPGGGSPLAGRYQAGGRS